LFGRHRGFGSSIGLNQYLSEDASASRSVLLSGPFYYLAALLITLLLALPAMSVELFRYRGAAKDGGTIEHVFEVGEQNYPTR
jgi:hypothetical protein